MHKPTSLVLSSIMLLSVTLLSPATTLGVAQGSTAGEQLATYSSCDQLNRDYRHGVSDRRMTKREWRRKGATGKGAYKPNLYDRVHSNLDRDDDHIACEA